MFIALCVKRAWITHPPQPTNMLAATKEKCKKIINYTNAKTYLAAHSSMGQANGNEW